MKNRKPPVFYKQKRSHILSFIAAVILTVVGFLISLPFTWLIIIRGNTYHDMDFLGFLMIVGFVLGGIMFAFGLVSILVGNRPVGTANTTDMDIARIRFEAERKK